MVWYVFDSGGGAIGYVAMLEIVLNHEGEAMDITQACFCIRVFLFDISLVLRRVSTLSMGKSLFSSSTEAYFNQPGITACDCFM